MNAAGKKQIVGPKAGQDSNVGTSPAKKESGYVKGKRKPLIKSGALRVKESNRRKKRLYEQIRNIPGYDKATNADILVAAHRIVQITSDQNIQVLLYHLLERFFAPMHHAIGKQIEVAALRERFFGIIEQTSAGFADQLRQSQEAFNSYAVGRLHELKRAVQKSALSIKTVEVLDVSRERGKLIFQDGRTHFKVKLKNGRAFLCNHVDEMTCLEPHPAFNGEKSICVRHADAISKFVEAPDDEVGDLRFELSDKDRVYQLTFFNVAWDAGITTDELRSAVEKYLEPAKKLA